MVREPAFSDFRTITSDVKPWRRGLNIAVCKDCGFPQAEVTAEWQESANEIYSDYASYYQTSDNDQTVFIDGASSGRGELFELSLELKLASVGPFANPAKQQRLQTARI